MRTPHIFVSHSHYDNAWCEDFVKTLQQQYGCDVWYDAQGISVGAHWRRVIERELQARDIFVVIISSAALSSSWVQDEITLALRRQKRIIGMLRELPDTTDLGFLANRQMLSVVGLSGAIAADELAQALGVHRSTPPVVQNIPVVASQSAPRNTWTQTPAQPASPGGQARSSPSRITRDYAKSLKYISAIVLVAIILALAWNFATKFIAPTVSLGALRHPSTVNTPTPSPSNASTWKKVNSPSQSASDILLALSIYSAHDIWAVGSTTGSDYEDESLTEHWDGSDWRVIPNANVGSGSTMLFGVTALSANNVWAVGDQQQQSGNLQTLIEHWDGTDWQVVSSPDGESGSGTLKAIAALSPTDIWAVGSYNHVAGAVDDCPCSTLIEHWDGANWRVISSPDGASSENSLWGIVALSSTDIWAVGNSHESSDMAKPFRTLIEHWDGNAWRVIASPNTGSGSNELTSIAGVSSSDIWAVGRYSANKDPSIIGPNRTLIEHWDGNAWRVIASPNGASSYGELDGIVARSANDVWAVGGEGKTLALIEHWGGSDWAVVSSPDTGHASASLDGVAAAPSVGVWAVGATSDLETNGSGTIQTLTEVFR